MVQPTDSSANPESPAENGEVAPYAGPPLVYGIFRPLGTLIVLEDEWARRAADEFSRYRAAKTCSEALAAAEAMTVFDPPCLVPSHGRLICAT